MVEVLEKPVAESKVPPPSRAAKDEPCPDVDGYAGLPLRSRVANLIAILLPMVGLTVGIVYMWGTGVGWAQLVLMTVMYISTGMGITIGYHRYFTHKSFSAGPVMVGFLGVMGSMAAEGSILRWCASHRSHHKHSDTSGDPHSPHGFGDGVLATLHGFWNAHMGWIFHAPGEPMAKYVPDLLRDRQIVIMSRLFPAFVILGLVIPTVIGGLIELVMGGGFWWGAFLGFIWGGLVRVFVVHHITWSVNSICHLWGSRPYRSADESRNNPIVGVLALGEGWHNNHHAFPTSARHGLEWWQFDSSWLVIRTFERLGLVRDVRVPTRERRVAKLRDAKPRSSKSATDS